MNDKDVSKSDAVCCVFIVTTSCCLPKLPHDRNGLDALYNLGHVKSFLEDYMSRETPAVRLSANC